MSFVGFRKPAPNQCKECKSFDLNKRGHGTQKIEDLVSELVPKNTKIRRVDADIMTKKTFSVKHFLTFVKER